MKKYTFISGAAGGLGSAFAKELALKGFNLFVTDISQEKLDSLKAELLQINANIEIITFACNLVIESQRQALINFVAENNVTFERLVNVAGVDIQKPFADYTAEKIKLHVGVNVNANVELTHAFLPRLSENAEILTVSSMSSVTPMPYFALYSATKALLSSLFMSLHYELKKKGIKVTVVMPGGIYTRPDIIQDIKTQGLSGKLSSQTPEQVVKGALKAVKKNKLKYIPGAFNKFIYFVEKITPLKVQLKFIAKRWGNRVRDAF